MSNLFSLHPKTVKEVDIIETLRSRIQHEYNKTTDMAKGVVTDFVRGYLNTKADTLKNVLTWLDDTVVRANLPIEYRYKPEQWRTYAHEAERREGDRHQ